MEMKDRMKNRILIMGLGGSWCKEREVVGWSG